MLLAAQGQPAESLLMGKRQIINGNLQQMTKATSNGSRKGRNLLSKQAEKMPFNSVWEHRQHEDLKVEKKADVGSVKGGTEA